jgi:hypothetical protein
MKKLFLTALCATTIVYGGETSKTSLRDLSKEQLIEKVERQKTKISNQKNGSYWKYGLAASLGSLVRANRLFSLLGVTTCATNIWRPNFFNETHNKIVNDTDFLKLKQNASALTRKLVKKTAETIGWFAKESTPATQTPANPEKPKDQ